MIPLTGGKSASCGDVEFEEDTETDGPPAAAGVDVEPNDDDRVKAAHWDKYLLASLMLRHDFTEHP